MRAAVFAASLPLILVACTANSPLAEDSRASGPAGEATAVSPEGRPGSEGLPATPPNPGERRLIDAHAHLYGPGVWEDIRPVIEGTPIAYFVNLSGGSPRMGMGAALELAEQSGGRIVNLMTVNWDGFGEPAWGETVAAELEIAVTRYGYAGLKISKGLGLGLVDETGTLVPVDDPRLFPLWEMAGELGVPVFIHTGDPVAFWQPVTPANERYAELQAHPNWSFAGPEFPPLTTLLAQRDHLVELFPQTTFICVHFGGLPEDIDYVGRLLDRFPNVYVDVAARVPEIGRHDPAAVRDLFLRHSDRILFGTDLGITRGRMGLGIMLGSSGSEPDLPEQIPEFYRRTFEYFETDHAGMAHPTPIQGNWTVDAIALPPEVLDRLYYANAYDLVVGPHLARLAAARAGND